VLYFLKFAASFLLPPGIIILTMAFLNLWLYRHKQRGARALTVLLMLFYLLSTSYVGDILLGSLESRYTPPQQPVGDVIILLGGGATADTPDIDGLGNLSGSAANRLLTAVRLQRQLHVPIIVSGGQVFADSGREAVIAKRILLGLGVPENQIIVEDASLNTAQNAQYVKTILQANGFQQPILVTSAFHMERSILNFSKQGVMAKAFPSDYLVNQHVGLYANKLAPSADGLRNVTIFFRELLGTWAAKWII
jgi:uncharacterized SAM-binding protein YcdF (DUF218 family)